MTPIEKAIRTALAAHRKQKLDEDGQPHIIHCMEVMLAVKKETETYPFPKVLETYTLEELMIAAVLHDSVEDSKGLVTLDRIEKRYGKNVRDIVDSVTRRGVDTPNKEFYRDFIYRAKANIGGKFVKNADVVHNFGRSHKIKQASWRNKLQYKYLIALEVLNGSLTWEEASWSVEHEKGDHFFVADPNGKKIEITGEEFQILKGSWAKAKSEEANRLTAPSFPERIAE